MGHVTAANDFARHDPCGAVFFSLEEIDGLSFIEGKKQLLRYGIIAVVLFKNLKTTSGVERAEDHGVGFEVSGDVGDLNVVNARTQVERELLPHDGELLVVNR